MNVIPSVPDDIREAGWMVAVHNDYRLNGKFYTFWLFTSTAITDDLTKASVQGEGQSDAIALNQIRIKLGMRVL